MDYKAILEEQVRVMQKEQNKLNNDEILQVESRVLVAEQIRKIIADLNSKGDGVMKHGKRPTRAQKMRLEKLKLNPDNWLMVKDCRECFEIVHRNSGKSKKLVNHSSLQGRQKGS